MLLYSMMPIVDVCLVLYKICILVFFSIIILFTLFAFLLSIELIYCLSFSLYYSIFTKSSKKMLAKIYLKLSIILYLYMLDPCLRFISISKVSVLTFSLSPTLGFFRIVLDIIGLSFLITIIFILTFSAR